MFIRLLSSPCSVFSFMNMHEYPETNWSMQKLLPHPIEAVTPDSKPSGAHDKVDRVHTLSLDVASWIWFNFCSIHFSESRTQCFVSLSLFPSNFIRLLLGFWSNQVSITIPVSQCVSLIIDNILTDSEMHIPVYIS